MRMASSSDHRKQCAQGKVYLTLHSNSQARVRQHLTAEGTEPMALCKPQSFDLACRVRLFVS